MHSPEFYVTPTISLGRLSIEQQRFPHSEDFFPCCSSLFFPWRNVEPLVLAALPHLCHPRAALAMEVVIKSLPHCFKRLGEHWERVEKRILTFVSCGQLGVFFPVSYFGNSWTILAEIFSEPEISAFKKKKKATNQPTSLEAFHSCGKFQLKKLKVWHIFRQGKMGSYNVTQP